MKLLKHLIACIFGCVAFVMVYGICTHIIRFLGGIPIIGSILYYPSDAAWALVAIPAPSAIFSAAWLSMKIVKTAKPISVILALFWLLNVVCMFAFHLFTWPELFRSVFGVVTSCICFDMDETALTGRRGKTFYVVDKETGEVVDENFRR